MFEKTSSVVKGHDEVMWWFKWKDTIFHYWRDVVRCALKVFIDKRLRGKKCLYGPYLCSHNNNKKQRNKEKPMTKLKT